MPGIGNPGTNPDGTLYGVADIEVAGADISGIEVRLQRGGSIAGRASFDPPLSSVPAETRLVLTPAATEGFVISYSATAAHQSMFTAPVGATGATFDFQGMAPGTYRLELRTSSGFTGRWWLRSAIVNDRDLLDAPIEINLGTALTNVAVTIAQRHTELAGTLQSATGIPAPESLHCRLARRSRPVDAGLPPDPIDAARDRRDVLIRGPAAGNVSARRTRRRRAGRLAADRIPAGARAVSREGHARRRGKAAAGSAYCEVEAVAPTQAPALRM